MTYKATYGTYFQNETVYHTTNICVGDIVEITDFGKTYPNYKNAYDAIWKNGNKPIPRMRTESKIGRVWRVMGFIAHYRVWRVMGFIAHHYPSHGILVGLQDRNFNKIVVDAQYITLVRKKIKDTNTTINIEITK